MTLFELTGQPQGIVVQGGEAITCEWSSEDAIGYPRMFGADIFFMGGERDARDIATAKKGSVIGSLIDWIKENGIQIIYTNGTTFDDYEVIAEMWTTESGVIIIAPDGWF